MFCSRLVKDLKFLRSRQFHSTLIKYEEKAVSDKADKPLQKPRTEENKFGSPLHYCTNFDKRILVWVKRFPSMDEVPDTVTLDCIQQAHSKARIRVCFIMMGFTIIGFIGSIILGKRDVAAGKNILTERLKYYEKLKQEKRLEDIEKDTGKQ